MPPMGNYSQDLNAEDLQRVALPLKFPCKDCGRDKVPASYSNKHIKDYRFRKFNQPGWVPTARNTSMKCRKCTGEQVHELQCAGPCGLWRPLDEFSKTQRTRGDHWCKDCISWKTSVEPGTVAQAAPNTDLAPDEDAGVQGGFVGDGIDDPEESDGYDDVDVTSAFCWQFETMSTVDSTATPTGFVVASTAASMTSCYVPPHLRGRQGTSTAAASSSVAPSTATQSNTPGYVPPHLRGISAASAAPGAQPKKSRPYHRDGGMSSTSSVSNPFEDRKTAASSSTIGRPVQYTGWDPSGQPHIQYRLPSGTGTATPPPAAAAPALISRPVTLVPASRPAITTEQARINGKWAKAVGTRNGGHKYTPPAPGPSSGPSRRANRGNDSDGSPDEM